MILKVIYHLTINTYDSTGKDIKDVDDLYFQRELEIEGLVNGLMIKWNPFDRVKLDEYHYDPVIQYYWSMYHAQINTREPDARIKAIMEMVGGGWAERAKPPIVERKLLS